MANVVISTAVAAANSMLRDFVPLENLETLTNVVASTQTAVFAAGINAAYVMPSANVHFEYGANPTATTGSSLLQAGVVHRFIVEAGNRFAFINA